MEPRLLGRRSSHGSKDGEIPLSNALEGNEVTTPVLEHGGNDASFEDHPNHPDEVEDESAADTALWREDPIAGYKRPSRGSERVKWWKVYTLHFLFMWTTRTYEYASVSVLFPCL